MLEAGSSLQYKIHTRDADNIGNPAPGHLVIIQRRIKPDWVCRHTYDKVLLHNEIVKPRNVYHDQQLLRYKKPIRLANASV